MAKKITGYIKLQVAAGKANPSPPIGPALGQRADHVLVLVNGVRAPRARVHRHGDGPGRLAYRQCA